MSPSFSSSTIAYNIKVAGDANNLNVVPTWDTTKFMTVKVNHYYICQLIQWSFYSLKILLFV